MDILQLLKENYSEYKINDSSDKNVSQIEKITILCESIPNLIVHIKRNSMNEKYFNVIELIEKSNGIVNFKSNNQINIIILNKDNYIYFRKNENDAKEILNCINKQLLNIKN